MKPLRIPGAWAELVSLSHTIKASDLGAITNRVIRPFGFELTIYLVDYEQRSLRPLPEPGRALPPPITVDGSLAGRAFQTVTLQIARQSPARLWVAIVDGTARLGVLAVDLPDDVDPDDGDVALELRGLASLLGHLLQSKSELSDSIEAVRRSRPMSVSSELLIRLVPPSTFACDELGISVVLEPAYDVGGDGYDYSVDGMNAKVVICDAVGHGMPAALTACAAVSALRAARRRGEGIVESAATVDDVITEHWDDSRFATAVVADIGLDTGVVRYVNAGHPPPALLRDGKVVGLLDEGRRLPLGLHDEPPIPAELRLQPGDRLLLYTDGVIEARDANDAVFGLDRLLNLLERNAASDLPTAETLRRLSHAILDHQRGELQDDATLMLVEWQADAARRAVP